MMATVKISQTPQLDTSVACAFGCKQRLQDADAASHAGWTCLPITGRWQCPQCYHELRDVNQRED